MNLTPVTIPKVVKKMFPRFVWNVDTEEKAIYLTFDDGPTPEITEWVLDLLNQYDAKVTFFCIGKNMALHPEIVQRIITEGHTIGNHTFNHLKGWKTKASDYIEDVAKAQKVIDSQIQKPEIGNQKLFRPPYGRIKPKQAKSLIDEGFKIVMWSILSLDWDNTVPANECYNNVINNSESGSIIVFHDSEKASPKLMFTLPKVLDYFSKKGFEFKRIH